MQVKGRVKFLNKDKSLFYSTVRARVDQYFLDQKIPRQANPEMIVKSVVLLAAYFLPLVMMILFHPPLGISLLLWAVMGFGLAGIGMSVMHDANHGAYSDKHWVNRLIGHSLILLGGSVFNWNLQHNILHHTFTNISKLDEDIDDRVVLRFSPHTKVKKIHRFQKFYALLFYGISTLYWCTGKDFFQFSRYARHKVHNRTRRENNIQLAGIIAGKLFYFFVFLILPVLAGGIPFWQVLLGFALMHFIAGTILTLVFQLAHTVEGTDHPVPGNEGTIENCWAIHQLNTTVNFSPDNRFLSWYLGGLNYQVEHHLFPKICHVHYPAIAPIVKRTAEEFGIPYLENRTFRKAVKSHFSTLARFGKLPDLETAIG